MPDYEFWGPVARRTARTPVGRARHLARTWLSERPALYLPLARRRYPNHNTEVIGPDTELVIDGYTRAASTYVVHAFQLAQPKPVRLAHHLHAPAQLIEAARRRLPTLVLVREPDSAVLSQAVREPHVTIRDGLLSYARFHERLLPFRDSFVVADFDEVTRDLRPAVQRLNDRFLTRFELPVPGDQPLLDELVRLRPTHWPTLLAFESGLVARQDLLEALRDPATRPSPPANPDLWLPSGERERAKQALRSDLEQPNAAEFRRRAHEAYRAFLDPVAGQSSADKQRM